MNLRLREFDESHGLGVLRDNANPLAVLDGLNGLLGSRPNTSKVARSEKGGYQLSRIPAAFKSSK